MRADRRTVAATVVAAGVGLIVTVLLRRAHQTVAIWFLPLLFALVVGTVMALRAALLPLAVPTAAVHGPDRNERKPPDLTARLEHRLSTSTKERSLYLVRLQPLVADLARDRLTERHRVNLDRADTDTVRRLLGDELYDWITNRERDGRAPSRATIERLVTALERI